MTKDSDISDVFGIAKGKVKGSLQQPKDEARDGWDSGIPPSRGSKERRKQIKNNL